MNVGHGIQKAYTVEDYSIRQAATRFCKQQNDQGSACRRSTTLQACADFATTSALDSHRVKRCGGDKISTTDGGSTKVCHSSDAITCSHHLEHQATIKNHPNKGRASPSGTLAPKPLHPGNTLWKKFDQVSTNLLDLFQTYQLSHMLRYPNLFSASWCFWRIVMIV